MSDEPTMTVAKLIEHLRRFPQGAEVVDLDVSVIIDAEANLVQSLSLWDSDGDDGDDPDDPEREDLPVDRDRKVVNLSPRRTKPCTGRGRPDRPRRGGPQPRKSPPRRRGGPSFGTLEVGRAAPYSAACWRGALP